MKQIWKPQPLKHNQNQEMKQFRYKNLNLSYQYFNPSPNKTTIVFFYGFGGNIEYLRDIAPMLSNNDKYSVLTIDYPGHGYSEQNGSFNIDEFIDYFIALLDHLKINKFILVGYSFGGIIALKLNKLLNDRVVKLIMLYSDLNFCYSLYKKYFYSIYGLMLHLGIDYSIYKVAVPLLSDKYMSKQYLSESREVINYNNLSHVIDFYKQTIKKNYEYLIQYIKCDTLVIGSTCDFLIPTKRYKRLHKLIPNSQLIINDDIGHLCVVTNSAVISKQILDFLQ